MYPAASHRGNDRVRWSPMTAESSDRVPESRRAEPTLGPWPRAHTGLRPSTEEVRNVWAQQPHGPRIHLAGRPWGARLPARGSPDRAAVRARLRRRRRHVDRLRFRHRRRGARRGDGLVATLATRFEPRTPAERRTMLRPAA